MSLPAYAQALLHFAHARTEPLSEPGWKAKLLHLCPDFVIPDTLAQCTHPPSLRLFEVLLEGIGQELQLLAAPQGASIPARSVEGGFAYEVGEREYLASTNQLVELWRFGIALDVPDDATKDLLARVQASLAKEIRGAWKVAQRRWKSFQAASFRLHQPGQERQSQARRLECGVSLLLSGPERLCSRSDLATDWLEGVDLWLHPPLASPRKGQGLALSMALGGQVLEKKAQATDQGYELWTPHHLASQLIAQLQGAPSKLARAAWEGLGSAPDAQSLEVSILRSFESIASCPRGRHPGLVLDPRFLDWLRAAAPTAKT